MSSHLSLITQPMTAAANLCVSRRHTTDKTTNTPTPFTAQRNVRPPYIIMLPLPIRGLVTSTRRRQGIHPPYANHSPSLTACAPIQVEQRALPTQRRAGSVDIRWLPCAPGIPKWYIPRVLVPPYRLIFGARAARRASLSEIRSHLPISNHPYGVLQRIWCFTDSVS